MVSRASRRDWAHAKRFTGEERDSGKPAASRCPIWVIIVAGGIFRDLSAIA